MTSVDNHLNSPRLTPAGDAEVIRDLKQAISSGKHWYIALLEAIGLWHAAEEVHEDLIYRYLIDGEAFDCLLLSERLCEAVDGLLPDDEKTALLFYGKPPISLTPEEFKELIGSDKYNKYLNYFYGIIVEEALILAVQGEVRKERWTLGYNNEHGYDNESYQRIYGATKSVLLKRFRRDKGYPQLSSASLTEIKEFTYWLFKYRLTQCDKSRVASDTKKALEHLRQQWSVKGLPRKTVATEATCWPLLISGSIRTD